MSSSASPATGKTLVGKEVSRRLGWRFIDTDAEIEARAGKSISRIFAEDGEAVFRLMEKRALREALSGGGRVGLHRGWRGD